MPYTVQVGTPTALEAKPTNPEIYGPDWGNVAPAVATPVTTVEGMQLPVTGGIGEALKGSPAFTVGQSKLAENQREKATWLDSAKAASQNYIGAKIVDWIQAPSYAAVPGYDPTADIHRLTYELSTPEREMFQRAQSPDEFEFMAFQNERRRKNGTVMGDNAGTTFITALADPAYLVMGAMTGGMASIGLRGIAGTVAARTGSQAAGRVASMVSWGVAEAAVVGMEGRIQPESTIAEAAGRVLLAAGAGAIVPGTKIPKDANFPGAKLRNLADDMATPNHVKGMPSEPHVEAAQMSKVLDETAAMQPKSAPLRKVGVGADGVGGLDVPSTASGKLRKAFSAREALASMAEGVGLGSDASVAAVLKGHAEQLLTKMGGLVDDITIYTVPEKELIDGSRAYYHPANHSIYIGAKTSATDTIHEIGHALTAHKLEYGMRNPESVHGVLTAQLIEILEDARKAAGSVLSKDDVVSRYYLGLAGKTPTATSEAIHEFAAGLWSGKENFHAMLAQMPDRWGAPILTKLVDTIRRLFGMAPKEQNALVRAMGISEKLMDTPLHVTFYDEALNPMVSRRMSTPRTPQAAVDAAMQAEQTLGERVGNKIAINAWKSMAETGEVGKRVADILADNPVNMTGNSATSQQRAIRADLSAHQYAFEDLLLTQLKAEGYGVAQRFSRDAVGVQQRILDDVFMELNLRDATGVSHSNVPHVRQMADAIDTAYAAGLTEMQKAGVKGAGDVSTRTGFFQRRWNVANIEGLENRLVAEGYSAKDAASAVKGLLSDSVMAKNGWEREVADDVAGAILSRAKARGYFDDVAALRGAGADVMGEFRSAMLDAGVSEERVQRALDKLIGQVDEAGKPATLKRRIDLDMFASIEHADGSTTSIMDLVDRDLVRMVDGYLDKASGEAALAKVGLDTSTKITALRAELSHSISDTAKRADAVRLFDNFVNSIKGLPVGEEMHRNMRTLQGLTQMVSLAATGLWQLTEFAPLMARFGISAVIKEALAELPGLRTLLGTTRHDPAAASQLQNILARNASQDMRLRPFIQKLEDNFHVGLNDHTMVMLQQGKQLVPYLNGLKYVQSYQARISANLIVDTLTRAAQGDVAAAKALAKYGLESHVYGAIRSDIAQHGMDTAKWSAGTWDKVRGPIGKMVDEAVLRNRTGEIPAFAQFSQVGKFVFTYRSFILGAHNKVLAGGLARDGVAGVGLAMMYQLPLSVMATLANNTIGGKKPMTEEELLKAGISQMGMLGLASEVWGAVSGTKQQFGAPGLIAIDRLYKLTGATSSAIAGNGSAGKVGAAALNMVPLWSTILPLKGIGEQLKEWHD